MPGLLGCCALAAVNNAAVNMGVQISLRSSFEYLWVYTQKWDCLDHMVILFLIVWGAAILFCTAAVPFYDFIHSAQAFHFLYILLTLIFYFLNSHPKGSETISLGFICISLIISDMSIFFCAYWPFVLSLEKCLLNSLPMLKSFWPTILFSRIQFFSSLAVCSMSTDK